MSNEMTLFQSEAEKMQDLETMSRTIIDSMGDETSAFFSSFQVETQDDRIKLYNAMSDNGLSVKDNVNKSLTICDVVVMPVQVVNEDKTTTVVPRCILIDKDGQFYTATSWGVYRSIQKIKAIFGTLHFNPAIKVMPVEVKTKNGFTMNLRLSK